jgi:hypothetical protein
MSPAQNSAAQDSRDPRSETTIYIAVSFIFINLEIASHGHASRRITAALHHLSHELIAGQANEAEKNISPHTRKRPVRALRIRV